MTMPLVEGGSTVALMTAATAFGAFISWIVKGAWRARTFQADLEKQIVDKINELREETAERRESMTREFAEGLAAIRQKTTDVEIWTRDNFVRHADFNVLRNDIKDLGSKLDFIILGMKNDKAQRQ